AGDGVGKLLSPARRRQAVLMLMDRKGLSERRACEIVGQHCSTQRRAPCVAPDDQALRARLRKFSKDRPRWGYRRAHCQLREGGWALRRRQRRPWLGAGACHPAHSLRQDEVPEFTPGSPSAPFTATCTSRCGKAT